jgi:hypothetical protein
MTTISYEANQIPQPNTEGTAWYVRGMKITGVAARLAKTTTKGRLYDFCKENRVAMTPAEQQVLAVKQPYMFPFETKCADGRKIFKDEILPMMMTKIDKELDPDKRVAMRYGCLHPYSEDHPVKIDVDDPEIYLDSNGNPSADYLYTAAVMRQHLYRNRHFVHGVLRERFDPKKHQHPDDCVISLVREEHHKRFKPEFLANSATFPKHAFIYDRKGTGSTCILVYFLDDKWLEEDEEAKSKRGKCNYWCANDIGVGDNDYGETDDHEFLSNEEISRRLDEFEKQFGPTGKNCDLSRWGAKEMWRLCQTAIPINLK